MRKDGRNALCLTKRDIDLNGLRAAIDGYPNGIPRRFSEKIVPDVFGFEEIGAVYGHQNVSRQEHIIGGTFHKAPGRNAQFFGPGSVDKREINAQMPRAVF